MKARPRIVLRRARPADADVLLAWRNDPATRRGFLDASRVRRAGHDAWFARILGSDDSRLYIAEEQGRPVGQLRLDRRAARTAEVSFSVDVKERGRGVGDLLLRRAGTAARRELAASRVIGVVKPENVASAVAFLKAGYRFTGLSRRAGQTTYVFELKVR
jgi:RimJ/RimL family protein N-acetyltransferase